MPQQNVPVQWQIAADENMRHVVRVGTAIATPELAHSVHIDVRGLESAREYFYQFKVGNEYSPIGRTKTAPAREDRVDQLNFAFVSCQKWDDGYYSAYRRIAEEDLDFFSRSAAKARQALISSEVSSEKSNRISCSVIPPARYSKISYTVIRIPRIQGLPLRLPGSSVIMP